MAEFPTIPPLDPADTFNPTTGHGEPDTSGGTEVKVTAPAHNATVAGASVTFTATCADDGDATVTFYIDGVPVHSDASSPWTYTQSFAAVSNGKHYLHATSTSASKLHAQSPVVTVTVANQATWARFDGVIGPQGCAAIADLSALNALSPKPVAQPVTAWDAHKDWFVTLVDASKAYWNGSTYVVDAR